MVQAQQWLEQVGSDKGDVINDIAVSGDNLYVTGFTRGAIPSGFEKQSVGVDAWLGQYDLASGTQQWVTQLGSDSLFNIPSDRATAVTTDSDGNVYIVGETLGTFGDPKGGSDGFIAQYDDNGNIRQIVQVGTNQDDVIEDIAIEDGSIYVVGSTKGAFGGFTNSDQNRQVWVAEYNPDLTQNWVKQFSVNSDTFSEAFALSVEGDNLFLAGRSKNPNPNGDFDGWLGRLDRTAPSDPEITTRIDTPERDRATDVTIDSANNIYVSGTTAGLLGTFPDSQQFGGNDSWLAQYNFDDGTSRFTENWISQVGTSEDDEGKGVITLPDDESDDDTDDNVILTGETEAIVDFDNFRDPSNPSEGFPSFDTNEGSVDGFLIQFDSTGNGGNPPSGSNQELPTTQFGSSSTDLVNSITTDEFGNILLAGDTFGNFAAPDASLGESDGWIAKYSQVDEVNLEQQFILIDDTRDPDGTLRVPLEENPGFSRKSFTRFQDDNLSFALNYTVSDDNENLAGLAIRIHFDSSKLTFNSLPIEFPFNVINDNDQVIQNDDQDLDQNAETDQFISVAWFDQQGNFPGEGELPITLARANFTTNLDFVEGSTPINFTAVDTPPGYELNAQNITVQGRKYNYDIDGNNEISAFSDGVLILRFLFGLRGSDLTSGDVSGEGAIRTSAPAIEDYLNQAGGGRAFDVDGNGEADGLTDGVLINRFLLGFQGNQLIEGAIADDATRQDAASIEQYLEAFLLETSLPEDGGDQNQGGENPDGNADGNNDDVVA
ncbi:UNVERIFIED_CONTAM: hypothetical protein BEN50_12400 [Euhalothece sp. KZN 001]